MIDKDPDAAFMKLSDREYNELPQIMQDSIRNKYLNIIECGLEQLNIGTIKVN